MNCEEVEELIGAYALGALPVETLADIGEHLVSCANHPEAADLRSAGASLAFAAPAADPSPALKTRIMAAVRAERPAPIQAKPSANPLVWLLRLMQTRLAPYALAAGLAVALVTLLLTNSDEGGGTVVKDFTDGGQARGQLVYIPDSDLAVVQAHGLEELPADKAYQVWALRGDEPASIGFLDDPSRGEVVTTLGVDLSGADAIAVTVEPRGGSPQPTTAPVLQARLR